MRHPSGWGSRASSYIGSCFSHKWLLHSATSAATGVSFHVILQHYPSWQSDSEVGNFSWETDFDFSPTDL